MATAQEWRERGNAFHTRKEHARAVECYTSAIGLDPNSAALRTNRAAAHHASRDFAAALDDARASVAIDPSWAKGHYRAGAALAAMDRHAEAADAFRSGLALDPSNQMLAQGLAAAEKAIADTPVDATDCKTRGNAAYAEGGYEEAIGWYTKGIAMMVKQSQPTHGICVYSNANVESLATLYVNRAECHRQLVDMRRVVEDCESALQLAPRSFKAHLRRALAMEYLEKYDEAAAGFKAAMAIDPSGTVASEGLRRVAAYKEVDG